MEWRSETYRRQVPQDLRSNGIKKTENQRRLKGTARQSGCALRPRCHRYRTLGAMVSRHGGKSLGRIIDHGTSNTSRNSTHDPVFHASRILIPATSLSHEPDSRLRLASIRVHLLRRAQNRSLDPRNTRITCPSQFSFTIK